MNDIYLILSLFKFNYSLTAKDIFTLSRPSCKNKSSGTVSRLIFFDLGHIICQGG